MADTGEITLPTTVKAHSDELVFDLGSAPWVAIVPDNRGTLALHMLTAKALLAIRRVAIFPYLDTMTCRTLNGLEYHNTPLSAEPSANDALPVAVYLSQGCSRKSTNPPHYLGDAIARLKMCDTSSRRR